jgi:hypothetical protein
MITDFYRLYCSCVKSQDKGVWLRRSEMMRFLHDYSRGEWSKAEIKQVAREVLNWQPALYHRIAIPLRNRCVLFSAEKYKTAGYSKVIYRAKRITVGKTVTEKDRCA